MELEELTEKIANLEKENKDLSDANDSLKIKIGGLEENIKEKDSRIVKLQESNMRFFEQLTHQENNTINNDKNKQDNDNKTVKIDDIIDLI